MLYSTERVLPMKRRTVASLDSFCRELCRVRNLFSLYCFFVFLFADDEKAKRKTRMMILHYYYYHYSPFTRSYHCVFSSSFACFYCFPTNISDRRFSSRHLIRSNSRSTVVDNEQRRTVFVATAAVALQSSTTIHDQNGRTRSPVERRHASLSRTAERSLTASREALIVTFVFHSSPNH